MARWLIVFAVLCAAALTGCNDRGKKVSTPAPATERTEDLRWRAGN